MLVLQRPLRRARARASFAAPSGRAHERCGPPDVGRCEANSRRSRRRRSDRRRLWWWRGGATTTAVPTNGGAGAAGGAPPAGSQPLLASARQLAAPPWALTAWPSGAGAFGACAPLVSAPAGCGGAP